MPFIVDPNTDEALTSELQARLTIHRALGAASANEHTWLIGHSTFRRYDVGDVVVKAGEFAQALYVFLRGHVAIRVDRGAGSHKIIEWTGGDVGGMLPYSRGAVPPSDLVVEEVTEMLMVHKDHFPEMIRECPVITTALVHSMLDRARQFTSSDLRDEKLVSLGKLAAGLAHELNNPASATVRAAKMLTASLDASETATRALGAARLSEEQLDSIDAIRAMGLKQAPTVMRSVLGRSDREDEFMEWLADHDADEDYADVLAETGVTIDALDALAAAVDPPVLNAVIKWMASGCIVRTLAVDIETAATRIHEIVGSVKGFTYMDVARTPQPVDIRRGIIDTLNMLASKIRAKAVHVDVQFAETLPRAHAVGGELNQVWMNLLDNAIDAVPDNGAVSVSASQELGKVVVRIVDNGHGIDKEIAHRIFDPFFSTKGVGKGTGLGLDLVRRLLKSHDGAIEVDSRVGRTEFLVRLPMA